MADVVLKISLQDRDIDSLKTKLQGLGNLPAAKVELDVKEAITKAHDLRTQLRDVSVAASQIKTPALSTVATGAKQAAIEARSLYSELKEIQTASGQTTDPKLFQGLQTRAREIEKDLDRLGTKLDRVASGRLSAAGLATPDVIGNPAGAEKAAASITKLGNASANTLKLNAHQMQNLGYQINDVATMLAMGASPFQIIASQGGQIYQTFGSVNQMLAFTQAGLAKLGLSFAGLGVAAGVGVIGAAIVARTKEMRSLAEQELQLQERISGEKNKQILALQQANTEYDRKLAKSREQYEIEKKIAGLSASSVTTTPGLNGQTASASELAAIRQKAEQTSRDQIAEINRLESAIRLSEQSLESRTKRGFSGDGVVRGGLNMLESYVKSKIEAETGTNLQGVNVIGRGQTEAQYNAGITSDKSSLERQKTSLEQAKQALAESQSTVQRVDQAFRDFSGNADKAFASRWEIIKKNNADAAAFAEKQREAIQKGIQKAEEVGKAWTSTLNGLATRVNDNPFTRVFMDARSEIDKLKEDLRGLPQDMQQAAIASQQAFNARQLFSAQVNSAMGVFELQETARRFRDDSAGRKNFGSGIYNRSVGEYQRMMALGYEGGGINEQANREYFARRNKYLDNNFNGESASDRLDRQMQSLSRLNPADDAQRAILDRSILGFASSIDPSQLRGDQRDQIASIAERSAERQMRQEMEALNEMKRQTDLLARIETATKELKGVAQKSGIAGVDNAINVNVNAPAGTEVQVMPSQPGPATVDLAMGGPGGLSNI